MSRMIKRLEGSLTVFFSMLLPLILFFMVSLISFGKARLLSAGIGRDLRLSANSALTEYDRRLVTEYGLYAAEENHLAEGLSFFLDRNSYHPYGSYQVSNLRINPSRHLGQTDTLKEEICHFMKERAWIDSIQEAAELFSQAEEMEAVQKEYANYRHSRQLYLIQLVYQQLVTNVYGIRADAGRNEYGVNLFLTGTISLTDLKRTINRLALGTDDLSEDSLQILEQGLYEITETLRLIRESEGLCEELSGLIRDLKAEEEAELREDPTLPETSGQLPVTISQLESFQQILAKNESLLENAEDALLAFETDPATANVSPIDQLSKYDRSIRLPHEMSKAERQIDFSRLFKERFGVTREDLLALAPDEAKSMEVSWKGASGQDEGVEAFDVLDLDFSSLLSVAGEKYLISQYCLGMFRNLAGTYLEKEGQVQTNLRNDPILKRHISNEAEYLVAGRNNEYENAHAVQNRITALRTLLNMAYLLADSEKRAQIQELAASTGGILMPGFGNTIAYGLILTGWSLWEARLDYQMLMEGGRVPLIKSDESWQSDLTLLLSGKEEERKPSGKGMSYRQYLRIFLWLTDDEQLLSRLQRLISLNLQAAGAGSGENGNLAASSLASGDLTKAVVAFTVSGDAIVEDGLLSTLPFHGTYGYD